MIPRSTTSLALATAERGLIPDALVRAGIRSLCRRRLASERERVAAGDPVALIRPDLARAGIAHDTDKANAQHYEVPAGFYELVLGPRLKYSSGYWGAGVESLAAAEEAALEISCEHADVADGQDILELGCGWGSLTQWMAERLPRARITAVSNSASQAEFIRARLAAIGRSDVRILTADMNAFDPGDTFDRIVSVEMFEHMRNWERLLERVGSWLRPEGRFFAHVFCHRSIPYLFEDAAQDDWMARHFFSGGLMPSAELMPRVATSLRHLESWSWSGTHYQRTADAWLARLDAQRGAVEQVLGTRDDLSARRAAERWRLFFMACAELFGIAEGSEWHVVHHLFEKEV